MQLREHRGFPEFLSKIDLDWTEKHTVLENQTFQYEVQKSCPNSLIRGVIGDAALMSQHYGGRKSRLGEFSPGR
jgi:hypothetical protein